jgi:hypothetical protein
MGLAPLSLSAEILLYPGRSGARAVQYPISAQTHAAFDDPGLLVRAYLRGSGTTPNRAQGSAGPGVAEYRAAGGADRATGDRALGNALFDLDLFAVGIAVSKVTLVLRRIHALGVDQGIRMRGTARQSNDKHDS